MPARILPRVMRKCPPVGEKYSIIGLLLAALVLAAGCSSGNFRVLEGEWTTKDSKGQETRLVFGPGARFRAIDGKAQKADGTYWEDFRQNPPWLDLKFSDGTIVQTIVKLNGETLEVQTVKSGEPRPSSFNNDAIIYTKADPILLAPTPASSKE